MSERRIRQADLEVLKGELKLHFQQEMERRTWIILKIFAVPLIGATAKALEILKALVENWPKQ